MTKKQNGIYCNRLLILLVLLAISKLSFGASVFPQPEALKPDIQFWMKVYSKINTKQGFLHDNAKLGIIYETLNLDGLSRKQRSKKIDKARKKTIRILKKLASGKRKKLSKDERRVLALWPKDVTNSELKKAQQRVRFQLGQSDKFKAGLKRSGRWRPYIKKTLQDMGLPPEIASLPQVESSFNPKAYSKVGAAGMWQFMRSTGRRFMRVDHVVDERMDPFIASVAAAQLLEQNYKTTGAWPLAITAYNHGAAGMRRAKQQVGTDDIAKIVRRYRSRTFKFASRNFYVAFLAAVNIHKNPEKYFGKIVFEPAEDNIRHRLPGYMSAEALADAAGISVGTLKQLNPALRSTVWSGDKYVPKGYSVRLPHRKAKTVLVAALAGPAQYALQRQQRPDVSYRVRRGDNLSTIAKRFKVSVRDLMAFNNLKKSHYIRIGQVLRLPQGAAARQTASAVNYGQYRVRAGDTMSHVAENFGMRVSDLMALNGLTNKNHLVVGQTLRVQGKPEPRAADNPQNYTVKAGDTLSQVAQRFSIPLSSLMARNGLTDRNTIVPGQILRLTGDSVVSRKSENRNTKTGTDKSSQPTEIATDAYIVKKGDSLISIANAHGIGLNDLLAVNDVRKRDVLRVGFELKVPKTANPPAKGPQHTYVVRRGDTISGIANIFSLTPKALLSINGLTAKNVIVPGQRLRLTTIDQVQPPIERFTTYQVKSGDSLISIANRHNISLQELLALNDVRKQNVLRVGKTLRVPKLTVQPSGTNTGQALAAAPEAVPPATKARNTTQQKNELSDQDIAAASQIKALDEREAIQAESESIAAADEREMIEDTPDLSLATAQPLLAADPNDYAVSDKNRITVLAGETLGHYADWLQIKTNSLRKANRMRYGKPVVIGKKIKLIFDQVTPAEFENARLAFHRSLQETYFSQYLIASTQHHKVRRGESIWELTQQKYNIPLWLLMQYNPDLGLQDLKPGDKIVIPIIQAKIE